MTKDPNCNKFFIIECLKRNIGLHFTKPTKVLKKPEKSQINKSYECFVVDQSSSYIILVH